jgi:hypothetical protein
MSERISDERLQYLTVHGFGALNLDDMLVFLKAEREEVERLQRRLRMADTVNRDQAESYEGKIKRTEARLNRLLERLEKHHHADTCFSRLVPPPDNTCDCWKSEIAEVKEDGDG